MTSPARIAASRANGAKSRGPKTAAGKARSCRNATKHGLLSRHPLPDPEPDPDLHEAIAGYLKLFPNPDLIELALIHELAAAPHRLRHLWAMEKQWLDELIAAQPASASPASRIANAFALLADTNKFRHLQRHEARVSRQHDRTLATLLHRRRRNKNAEMNLNSPGAPAINLKSAETNLNSPLKSAEFPGNNPEKEPQIPATNPGNRPPNPANPAPPHRCPHRPESPRPTRSSQYVISPRHQFPDPRGAPA